MCSTHLTRSQQKNLGRGKNHPNRWKHQIPGQEAAGLPQAKQHSCAVDAEHCKFHSLSLVPGTCGKPRPASRRARRMGRVQPGNKSSAATRPVIPMDC